MKHNCVACFEIAAKIFPLNRTRRLANAYAYILLIADQPEATAQAIREVLPTDSTCADLWYHMTRMDLKLDNKEAYSADLEQLRKLTPRLSYSIVREPAIEGDP